MGEKILIVDDSATIRQQLSFTLSKDGFEVVEAVDGVEGIAKLGSVEGIALVVSDVNMPNMGGLEMLEALKTKGSTIPVIMLTTEGSKELIERAKLAGAKGWLVKPFKPEQIIQAVKKLAG